MHAGRRIEERIAGKNRTEGRQTQSLRHSARHAKPAELGTDPSRAPVANPQIGGYPLVFRKPGARRPLVADAGTGVAMSRNASTGEKELEGDFLMNAQGEDVVAGIRTPQPITLVGKAKNGTVSPCSLSSSCCCCCG